MTYIDLLVIPDEVLSNKIEKECLGILDIFVTLHEDLLPFMHAQ
jgi:hypothetical protein